MSTLKVGTIQSNTASTPPTIQDSNGTQVGTFCRAWVNFNGTGTVAIRASFNVTSITDNGTGDYTVNFATPMVDANYGWAVGGSATSSLVVAVRADLSVPTASALRLTSYNVSFAGTDAAYINVSIFR